jgi:hypothetical protein
MTGNNIKLGEAFCVALVHLNLIEQILDFNEITPSKLLGKQHKTQGEFFCFLVHKSTHNFICY